MNIALFFLIIYFVAMALIGVWKRSSTDSESYLLGDRSLGPVVTALRLQSSSMSGYMFLGAGSLAYTQGYFSMWYALGDIGGGIINLSILGRRMRKLSQKLGSLTSIEYLEHRYESKWVRLIAAPIALGCVFLYVLAQFVAGGSGLAGGHCSLHLPRWLSGSCLYRLCPSNCDAYWHGVDSDRHLTTRRWLYRW